MGRGSPIFPGCTNSAFVDGHHIKHWADGGETSLASVQNQRYRAPVAKKQTIPPRLDSAKGEPGRPWRVPRTRASEAGGRDPKARPLRPPKRQI